LASQRRLCPFYAIGCHFFVEATLDCSKFFFSNICGVPTVRMVHHKESSSPR